MTPDRSPPLYSPATICPTYSPLPKFTERTLQRSSAAGPSRISSTGYFISRSDDITLVLQGQESTRARPPIGPGGLIDGKLIIGRANLGSIRAVELKIDGLLESVPLAGADSKMTVVSISSSLYSYHDSCCPSSLPFSHRFPSIFEHGDDAYVLPPTCHITFDSPQLFINTSVELDYRPQAAPSSPIVDNLSFLSTIKQCPEEWTQVPVILGDKGNGDALVCDVTVCSIGKNLPCLGRYPYSIFSCADKIRSCESSSARDRERFNLLSTRQSPSPSGWPLSGELQCVWANETRGGASFWVKGPFAESLPPSTTMPIVHGHTLNWEGEARCKDPATVGGFDAGLVIVKDSIVVEISPPPGSSLRRTCVEHPIRLTADE
ncbi:hypothetical protein DFH09DRAFT_1459640 [Mycena vulgaris]|nr:hypothetical protein DFH09DRAFT_1459640 [Mycena vulgaris]